MALLTKQKYNELAEESGEYCISVFIPTKRSGENKESIIRLKNQIAKIESELSEYGLKPKEVENYTNPLNQILEDTSLWRHLSDALIIFKSKNVFYYTTLALKVDEFSLVSDRFYLLPLLSAFNNNDKFFILKLSLNNNELYEATQNEITEIVTENILPGQMKDSVGRDVKEKSLQFRTGQTGQSTGMYHGKGEGKDDKKIEASKYLTEVSKGLEEIIEGYNTPFVVAAVDNIFSLFKEVSSYKNIYSEFISGNPDEESVLLLHEKACEILAPYFNSLKNAHKDKYLEDQKNTTSDIKEIIKAANTGSIDTLFVNRDEMVWGIFNEETNQVEIHKQRNKSDSCLLDLAARLTFLKGGNVFVENSKQLPEPNSVANAILRF